MRVRENGPERGPERLRPRTVGRETLARRFQPPLGLRSRRHAVAADELHHPQYQRGIAFQLRGVAQKQPLARDREIHVGKPRTVLAEVLQQRSGTLLDALDGPPRFVEDGARGFEIPVHPVLRTLAMREELAGQAFASFEIQNVVVASGAVVQKAARRGNQRGRAFQFAAGRFGLGFEGRHPIDQPHILQPAGALFDIGFGVVRGVLVAGMARAHQVAKVLAHLLAVQRQRRRQFAFQPLVDRAVPRQQPPVQQAECRHASPLDCVQALANREHRGIQP